MTTYPIADGWTLREVYLAWLIALDPKAFAEENNLVPAQLVAFREVTQYTWRDFDEARLSGVRNA